MYTSEYYKEFDSILPPREIKDALYLLNSENREFYEVAIKYEKIVSRRREIYDVQYAGELKHLRANSKLRGKDALDAEAELRTKWACYANEAYVNVLVEVLLERDNPLSIDQRRRLQSSCEEALNRQLSDAGRFLNIGELSTLLFGSHSYRVELSRRINGAYFTAAPTITKRFDELDTEIRARRETRMAKQTYNTTIINNGGSPNNTITGNIYNNQWTATDFHNIAGALSTARGALRATDKSGAHDRTVGLLAEAEDRSNGKDQPGVVSALKRITVAGRQAIMSVAPEIASRVLVDLLRQI